jgi:hypothetical protein
MTTASPISLGLRDFRRAGAAASACAWAAGAKAPVASGRGGTLQPGREPVGAWWVGGTGPE